MKTNKLSKLIATTLLAISLPVTAATTTPRSLIVGVYKTEDGAEKAYKELKKVQKAKDIKIDAFAVIEKNNKGHVSVRDTQQHDAAWGAIAGGLVGLLAMGPVAGAAAGLGAGGLAGWLTGREVGIPKEDINNVKAALKPNTSAMVAIIDNKWVADVEKTIKKEATAAYINQQLATPEQPTAGKTESKKSGTAH